MVSYFLNIEKSWNSAHMNLSSSSDWRGTANNSVMAIKSKLCNVCFYGLLIWNEIINYTVINFSFICIHTTRILNHIEKKHMLKNTAWGYSIKEELDIMNESVIYWPVVILHNNLSLASLLLNGLVLHNILWNSKAKGLIIFDHIYCNKHYSINQTKWLNPSWILVYTKEY